GLHDQSADGTIPIEPMHCDIAGIIVCREHKFSGPVDADMDRPGWHVLRSSQRSQNSGCRVNLKRVQNVDAASGRVAATRLAVARYNVEIAPRGMRPRIL